MSTHRLLFDTTDANTIEDSANVGAYLRSSDGTLLTNTTDGSREALDVFTELGKAEDSAHVSGDIGAMALAVRNDVEGTLVDTDGDFAPLQVDASGRLRVISDLDYTDPANQDEDAAHSSGDTGKYVLSVREDTLASSTDADGDYQSFKTDSLGKLWVNAPDSDAILTTIDAVLDTIKTDTAAMVVDLAAIEAEQLAQGVTLDSILVDTSVIAGDTTSIDATLTALSKAEDSAHVSGDQGIMSLAVRNDTLSSLVDADGDYASLQVNADGALYVKHDGDLTVSDTANTAIAHAANALDVANTAEDVVAAPLADRKYLFTYNNGNRIAYVGASGVSAATGFPLPPGAILELRAGPAIDIEWVSSNTSQELRTLELS